MRFIRILLLLFLILAIWIAVDLGYPHKTDIGHFNGHAVAGLETQMWKSYYEKKKLQLFLQTSSLMRKQFGATFWRSQRMAFHAARAAFIFKDGRNRADYGNALPDLVRYYGDINDISLRPFDVREAARLELEWWIIRRYRSEYSPEAWEKNLALLASTVYHLPPEKFVDYAHYRVQAMLLRDEKGEGITEADWKQINGLLDKAWQSFTNSLGT